jgi:hypothetical protein
MSADPEGHRFNDDILIKDDDLVRAGKLFPKIAFALDDPDLREVFHSFDLRANASKKKSRVAGLLAIGFGTASLWLAAAAPLYHDWSPIWLFVIGAASAVTGVLSISIGLLGVLFAGQKREWLRRRVMTERLRQLHFQTFICRSGENLQSIHHEESIDTYKEKRKVWFGTFMATLVNHLDSELTDLIDDESDKKCWLHPLPTSFPSISSGDLSELFSAYRELRIVHQLHYANYKLRSDQKLTSWPARTQEVVFSYTGLCCIFGILVMHLLIAVSVILGSLVQNPEGTLPVFLRYDLPNDGIHVAVIWVAILALAARALQEGLQPERELERYRLYRASIRAIRDRFDQAESPPSKFEAMLEMERLTFDEMRNFLRASLEARFVM